ncbi:MAG: hypothetical protein HC814_00925 [Rhodobacteraceae bacterium]|nr:hypothetical protein [Paracoccaceae bacterium]
MNNLANSLSRHSLSPFLRWVPGSRGWASFAATGLALAAILIAGCASPIGADRVTTRQAYDQVDASALGTGKPSAKTKEVLHRYSLDQLVVRHPDEAVRQLHEKAVATGERDLLFALAEISYVAGDHIRRSVKPWDQRDARDYYLGSAVYAYLFLFGDGKDPKPSPYDRRFRGACDLYNYTLGLAFGDPKGTNASIRLEIGRRQLPVGGLELSLKETPMASRMGHFEDLLLADKFQVHGLSVRNREAGLGTPLFVSRRSMRNWEFALQRRPQCFCDCPVPSRNYPPATAPPRWSFTQRTSAR